MRFSANPRFAVLVLALVMASPRLALADDATSAADTFERIVPSLATIVSGRGKTSKTGTGFCIHSDASGTVFLTNKHVADTDDVFVRLSLDGGYYSGRVIRRGTTSDIAVVAIARPNLKCVTLASGLPKPGTAIAVAGYPSIQMLLNDLKPSVHLGSVNALNGSYIQHDALTDHGNSGGPLFDRSTGVVYGINTFGIDAKSDMHVVNYFAISTASILSVLDNAKVAYQLDQGVAPTQAVVQSGPPPESPRAYRVAFVTSRLEKQAALSIKQNLDQHILELFSASVPRAEVVPALLANVPDAMARLCQEQQVTTVLLALYDWGATPKGFNSEYLSHVSVGIFDCVANPIYVGKGESQGTAPTRSYEANYRSTTIAAADNAFAIIRPLIEQSPSMMANLLHYGVAVADGQRFAGVLLQPGASGAIVSFIAHGSIAERSGMQVSSTVLAINGVSLAGLQQVDISTLLQQVERSGGKYDVRFRDANAHERNVTFKSESLEEYLRRIHQ